MTQGTDPVHARKAKLTETITLKTCFEDYLVTRHNLKPGTRHDYERSLNGSLKDWQQTPLTHITKHMVIQRHRKLGEKSKARANNTMRLLRALFNFAIYHYEKADGSPLITVNPVKHLSECRAWYRVERRQTWIKPHELAAWYQATLELKNTTTRDYLHFLLLTGLRRTEAAKLAWELVDFSDRSFIIVDTKNHRVHALPLSDYLFTMLKKRFAKRENAFVFQGQTDKGYLLEPRAAIEKVVYLSGITFTPHDLRRTFITVAESLDIPSYALKHLLNHKMANDVTAGYIVPNTERLRIPMQRITDYFLRAFNTDSNVAYLQTT